MNRVWLFLGPAIVLLIIIIYGLVSALFKSHGTDLGTFGDSFGVLNSMFSGLAFMGLLLTVYYQGKQIKINQDQMEDSKKEIADRLKIATVEKFESGFFNLLNSHTDVVNSLVILGANGVELAKGKACFSWWENELRKIYLLKTKGSEREQIEFSISEFYKAHASFYGYYFRHLYNIYNFISEHTKSNIYKEIDYYTYAKILRSRLSRTELFLLFYNTFHENGSGFRAFIKRFKILKSLKPEELLDEDHGKYLRELL